MDEARLPFTMNATVSYGTSPPEPLPDRLPPGWVRIPVSFQVTLPAEVMEGARQGSPSTGAGHGPGTSVSIVPHSLRLDAGAGSKGGRSWEDLGALVEALQDDPSLLGPMGAGKGEPGPQPPAPGARSVEASVARSVPIAAAYGPRSTGRFDMNRLANVDLNALGLGEALRPRSAACPGAPFVRAPFAGPGPAAAEDDVPALAGATPSSGTGRRALDIVMTPGAPLPPVVRAVVGGAGGSRAGQGSATSAGTSGADANGDVLAMLQGMREADRSPRPTGSVEVAQAGGSNAVTLPRAEGQPAAAPRGHPSTISVPPAPPKVSNAGRALIEKEEELPGVSNTLHHPSAASGVTLGPGYDMKKKSADQIISDLVSIGVAPDVAKKISTASHLPAKNIKEFIKDNKTLLDLSSEQQARLLASSIGPYEDKVRRDITVPLKPYQFDALVSFLYNPGHGWPAVRDAINSGDFQAAAVAMKKQVKSGGKVLKDLVERRQQEADLLLTGEYGSKE